MSESLDPSRFRPEPTLTTSQAAEGSGLDPDLADRLRRALALPEWPPDEPAFTEDDVEVFTALKTLLDSGIAPDDLLSVGRVYGQSLSRIADAEMRVFRDRFVDPLFEQGLSNEEVEERLAPLVSQLVELLEGPISFVRRRHLEIALRQLTVPRDTSNEEITSVAFVDLVGFSGFVDDLPGADVGRVIDRFEEIAIDMAVERDVRLVKTIGDAVMLSSPTSAPLIDCCRSILAGVAQDELLPTARAGIDHGPVVPLGGDLYGRTVNVAARATAFARPETIVITQEVLDTGEIEVSKIGTKRLKGVGTVRLFKVREDEDHEE